MEDAQSRCTERRRGGSGSIEDHARWIQEQLRLGRLPLEAVQLAARLGHLAAGLAVGGLLDRSEWELQHLLPIFKDVSDLPGPVALAGFQAVLEVLGQLHPDDRELAAFLAAGRARLNAGTQIPPTLGRLDLTQHSTRGRARPAWP